MSENELANLKKNPGATKKRRRIGRGESSGWGKTAGRGEKGQKKRSGGSIPPGFEGGQMPMHRRLPKIGFTNPTSKHYAEVNVERLNVFDDGAEVTYETLKAKGIVKKRLDGVKLLGRGELSKKLTVKGMLATAGAKAKIEAKSGTITE